jgi:hypothetical protein
VSGLWTALVLIGVLFIIIFIVPVRILVTYKRAGRNDYLQVQVNLIFGLIRFHLHVPALILKWSKKKGPIIKSTVHQKIKLTDTKKSQPIRLTYDKIKLLIRIERLFVKRYRHFHRKIRKVTKTLQIERLEWNTQFGIGDAAITGTSAGLAWAVKWMVIAFISRSFSMHTFPEMKIQPHFHQLMFRTELSCLISFRLGRLLFASTLLAFYLIRSGSLRDTLQKAKLIKN